MIDKTRLLADLQPLVATLQADLHTRLAEDEPSHAKVHAEYQAARAANRTAAAFEPFAADHVTQVAVAWVLACVFVRFVEDNQLVDAPWLAGPDRRLAQAKDRYTAWLRQHPHDTDRDYLLHVFTELGKLPGLGPLLSPDGHSLVHALGPTADGARALREFWYQVGEGGLVHDFTDPAWDTRFLGDLYQDLSEHAQKKYALLQTPEFIEEFILDRTLEPALAEFGLADTRLIDPACGSGHFLLGAFARLFARWQQQEPGTAARVLAERALDAVAGVDLNPFAVAIARFRLLLAALRAASVRRLVDAFDYRPKVATGDSLLHGRGGARRQRTFDAETEATFDHFYGSEDPELLREIFGRTYGAVVGNPPYITPKDAAANKLYRERFPEVCHRQYSLGVPFTQLFFELARPRLDEKRAAGFAGMITANSFMKREFGKKLIEEYLAGRVELTHMLDMSGASVPGHGTPTVILLGRARAPVSSNIRAVLGIKGEQSTPDDPAKGLVWSSIVELVDRPGMRSEFVSCDEVSRERFAQHPWSLGGGGAAEVKELIEGECTGALSDHVEAIGRTTVLGEDDQWLIPVDAARWLRSIETQVPLVVGDAVRDWCIDSSLHCIYPYAQIGGDLVAPAGRVAHLLWPARTMLARRTVFGKSVQDVAGAWYAHLEHYRDKLRTPLSIAFAFVATHNHFVLDRGGKVFKQSAPVIKLPAGASENEHLGLLGILNSSVACFWLKQTGHCKGNEGVSSGIKSEAWEKFYEFTAGTAGAVPLCEARPSVLARRLDALGTERRRLLDDCDLRSADQLTEAASRHAAILAEAIALQEELDWTCYRLYGLLEDDLTYHGADLPGLSLGERAFEVVLARDLAAGNATTTWFERHGSTPITAIPAHWPKAYRDVVQRRIDAIARLPEIKLIEVPEYKRRWNLDPWEHQVQAALRRFLLDHMEAASLWREPHLTTTARFADQLRRDADFVQVAGLYRGRADFDFDALVRELVEAEGVPFLPVLRYKGEGLVKRTVWERTWDLQRQEDAIDARAALPQRHADHLTPAQAKAEKLRQVGSIPVPPKYAAKDFLKSDYMRLRGKLDVPKERFILYPHAERADHPSPVFTWAGFDHLQQARALATWLIDRKEQDGWQGEKLVPLYAGLHQLLPWLKQWHNDVDPESNQRLGDYFAGFLDQELRAQGLTVEHLTAWKPPARGRGRKKGGRKGRTADADGDPDTSED